MKITLSKLKRHEPFSITFHRQARDRRLSLEARGLFSLLMSFPDNWVFRSKHLRDNGRCGRDRMQRMLRELREAGYLTIEKLRATDGSGRMVGSRWVFDSLPPGAEEFQEDFEDDGLDDDDDEDDLEGGGAPEGSPDAAAETAKTPANHREPENPALGEDGAAESGFHREPEKPVVGKPGPLERMILKNNDSKESPLPPNDADRPASPEPRRRSARAPKKRADEPVALSEAEVIAAAARQWAPYIVAGSTFAAGSVKLSIAHSMLNQGLVTPEQLRACGVTF